MTSRKPTLNRPPNPFSLFHSTRAWIASLATTKPSTTRHDENSQTRDTQPNQPTLAGRRRHLTTLNGYNCIHLNLNLTLAGRVPRPRHPTNPPGRDAGRLAQPSAQTSLESSNRIRPNPSPQARRARLWTRPGTRAPRRNALSPTDRPTDRFGIDRSTTTTASRRAAVRSGTRDERRLQIRPSASSESRRQRSHDGAAPAGRSESACAGEPRGRRRGMGWEGTLRAWLITNAVGGDSYSRKEGRAGHEAHHLSTPSNIQRDTVKRTKRNESSPAKEGSEQRRRDRLVSRIDTMCKRNQSFMPCPASYPSIHPSILVLYPVRLVFLLF